MTRSPTRRRRPIVRRRLRPLWLAAVASGLAGCAIATAPMPEPTLDLPADYRHAGGWLATAALPGAGDPADGGDRRWWRVFRDPGLDALLVRVAHDNATLEQAAARWRQAEAAVEAARADRAARLDGSLSATRAASGDAAPRSRIAAGLSISWMPDVWGRVALQRQAAQAGADAAADDLAAARLALQLAAAEAYVALRLQVLDARLLDQTLAAYRRSLELTDNQYRSGFVARSDVIQARIQLESVEIQIAANRRQQALSRNALARLAGLAPAQPALAELDAHVLDGRTLDTPPAVPAQAVPPLLLRRPDVAAAARRLAAANAGLGLARTAWLPDLSLGASAGLESSRWSRFLESPARLWSLGPALAARLLDGGARRAASAGALAEYQALAAAWRASVLQAVQEVENALASAQWLAGQERHQRALVALAGENLRVVQNQYESGLVSYLEVATAQNLALGSQRGALDLQARRLQASMQLIAALGGDWRPSAVD